MDNHYRERDHATDLLYGEIDRLRAIIAEKNEEINLLRAEVNKVTLDRNHSVERCRQESMSAVRVAGLSWVLIIVIVILMFLIVAFRNDPSAYILSASITIMLMFLFKNSGSMQ